MAIIGGVILPENVIGQLSGRSPVPQESLEGIQGETFEILPLHSLQNPRFSWILLQDRKFIERAQSSLFRTRFSEAGLFTLNVEVTSNDGGTKVRRMFEIDVRKSPADLPSEYQDVLVTLNPKAEEQAVILSKGKNTVLLSSTNKSQTLSLDANVSLDTDGDGNPKNDNDASESSFSTEGNPLYLWFTSPVTIQPIIVHAANGKIQEFFVASPEFSKVGDGQVDIKTEISTERTVLFIADFAEGQKPASPSLFYWNFGDGKESLLENPTHQYGSDGEYDVQLTIRNLESGVILMSAKKKITVREGISDEQKTGEKTFTGRIFFIGGGIVIALLVLGGISILLMRFLRKKVQSPTEETLTQKSAKKPPEGSVADLGQSREEQNQKEELEEEKAKEKGQKEEEPAEGSEQSREEQVPQKELEKSEETDQLTEDVQNIVDSEKETQRAPPIDMTKAPAWLQKGLDMPIGSQKEAEETPLTEEAASSDAFDGTTPPLPQEPQAQEPLPQEPVPEWMQNTPPSETSPLSPPLSESTQESAVPSEETMTPPDSLPQDTSTNPMTEPQEEVSLPPNLTTQPPKKRRRRRPRNRNRSANPQPQGPGIMQRDASAPLESTSPEPVQNEGVPPPSPSPIPPVSPPSEEIIEKPDENEPVAFIQVDSIPNASKSPPVREKGNAVDEENPEEEETKTS